MKAIVFTEFGQPDVMQLKDVEKPTPKNDEILIKVHATLVAYGDLLVRNLSNVSMQEFFRSLGPKKTLKTAAKFGVTNLSYFAKKN